MDTRRDRKCIYSWFDIKLGTTKLPKQKQLLPRNDDKNFPPAISCAGFPANSSCKSKLVLQLIQACIYPLSNAALPI
ncbi:hypothetical protein AKJ16_DCAP26744 [Drosera capensis]